MPPFKVVSEWSPAGDQPQAIERLAEGVQRGDRFQTLLGITGSGKSATIAWTIEQVQRPTLVIEPNKSLAAQFANEMREIFPHNRVEYFVSYYDYYQPEAYIPSSDTYIEKDSSINDEIDRLRHSATSALLTRRDVIVVASVSCIYGLGSPEEYGQHILALSVGHNYDQRAILGRLVDMQYERNDANLVRGQVPCPGRHRRGPPRLRGAHPAHRALRRRSRAHDPDRPGNGRSAGRNRRGRHFPGHALCRRRRADAPCHRRHRGRAPRAPGLFRKRGQATSKLSACACAPATTWR